MQFLFLNTELGSTQLSKVTVILFFLFLIDVLELFVLHLSFCVTQLRGLWISLIGYVRKES